jgi:hypothetical protein
MTADEKTGRFNISFGQLQWTSMASQKAMTADEKTGRFNTSTPRSATGSHDSAIIGLPAIHILELFFCTRSKYFNALSGR